MYYTPHTLTDQVILDDSRQHNNRATVSFIDHLPEVSTGVLHWPLGDDESLLLLVALHMSQTRSSKWQPVIS